jgi:hypothetical protein
VIVQPIILMGTEVTLCLKEIRMILKLREEETLKVYDINLYKNGNKFKYIPHVTKVEESELLTLVTRFCFIKKELVQEEYKNCDWDKVGYTDGKIVIKRILGQIDEILMESDD